MAEQKSSFARHAIRLLASSIGAGLIAYLIYQIVKNFHWSQLMTLGVPVVIAVTLASLLTSLWQKGFSGMSGQDYLRGLMSGLGALIGLAMAYFLF